MIVRVHNEKIDNCKITAVLFQPVGHIKVFFYVPISDVRYESIYRSIAILGLYRDTDMHTRVSID